MTSQDPNNDLPVGSNTIGPVVAHPVRIQAEPVKARDLKPGDLFSTAGPDYWDNFEHFISIGERAYIRTNTPAYTANDADEIVYRLTTVFTFTTG